jgi:COMPASS component SWD2
VLCGAEDGCIYIWETVSGKEVAIWHGHPSPVGVVLWNPKYMMAASACQALIFWVPTFEAS